MTLTYIYYAHRQIYFYPCENESKNNAKRNSQYFTNK